ncbi:MAG: hypothetical protein ACXWQO_09145 [Bdellovibrionota bacterium]
MKYLAASLLFCFSLAAQADNSPIPEDNHSCTELGCAYNGLFVAIQKDYVWKSGDYKFVFNLDGKSSVCRGKLPLSSCDARASVKCEDPRISIGAVGCAVDPSLQGFDRIVIAGKPQRVSLEVFRGLQEIGSSLSSPEYFESYPNGKECKPVCTQGQMQIRLR